MRDERGRFVERERRIAREHGQFIAAVVTGAPTSNTPTPSPSGSGMEGGFRGRSLEREKRTREEAWRRLFEPAPLLHEEVTHALPPVPGLTAPDE